jgi:hypothetical protein
MGDDDGAPYPTKRPSDKSEGLNWVQGLDLNQRPPGYEGEGFSEEKCPKSVISCVNSCVVALKGSNAVQLGAAPALSTETGQRAQKGIIVPRSIVLLAVDEKARRSVDAALHSAHEIVPYPALESPLGDIFHKLRDVETELSGVLHERFLGQSLLILIESVVHFPEFSGHGGGFGRLSREFGTGMCLGQGEISEDKAQFAPESRLEILDDRVSLTAIGALIISIFEQGRRGLGGALNVIGFRDRNGQAAHLALFPANRSSSRRMPSAPGFIPIGET